jgi:ATP-dependent RNA helicase RhlE
MQFSQLGLSQPILRALEAEGYITPTPIQAQAIPHGLAGRDILGSARTGTGKTAAFALPILHRLSTATIDKSQRGPHSPRALILSPTRELAAQIGESFRTYGRDTHLSHAVIFGGVSQHHQERALRKGVDILVATPGRLIDLMEQRLADLSRVEVFVLDEADRMLDMGFIHPIRRIAAATRQGAHRQTMLFSATMPKEIVHLAHALLRDPVKIAVDPVSSAAPRIEQVLFMVPRQDKQSLLEHLLSDVAGAINRAIVFTRTKHGADKVGRKLLQVGIQAETIHGNKSQGQRKRALDRFSSGAARVLVATDVAARGLDVDDISHVVNFDLPVEPEAYVHRIGRTGRAGSSGIAISFCDAEERGTLRDIERLTGRKIAVQATPALSARPAWRQHVAAPVADRPHPHPKRVSEAARPAPHAGNPEHRPSRKRGAWNGRGRKATRGRPRF